MISIAEFLPELTSEAKSVKIEAGESHYKVTNVEQRVSQAGNPMIALTLSITDKNDNQCVSFDNLVFTKKAIWKLSQFCKSCGREGLYKQDNLDPNDLLGASGMCLTKYEPNKDGKEFIRVGEYLHKDYGNNLKDEKQELNVDNVNFDDDVPF